MTTDETTARDRAIEALEPGRAWPTRDGQFGIQQVDGAGVWTSNTIWCGYENAEDAIAIVQRLNTTTDHQFRVFHRGTGEVVTEERAR